MAVEQTAIGPVLRNGDVTVGVIRQIIADLPDDAPVEILVEGCDSALMPSGASVSPTATCRDGLQLFVRDKQSPHYCRAADGETCSVSNATDCEFVCDVMPGGYHSPMPSLALNTDMPDDFDPDAPLELMTAEKDKEN